MPHDTKLYPTQQTTIRMINYVNRFILTYLRLYYMLCVILVTGLRKWQEKLNIYFQILLTALMSTNGQQRISTML